MKPCNLKRRWVHHTVVVDATSGIENSIISCVLVSLNLASFGFIWLLAFGLGLLVFGFCALVCGFFGLWLLVLVSLRSWLLASGFWLMVARPSNVYSWVSTHA